MSDVNARQATMDEATAAGVLNITSMTSVYQQLGWGPPIVPVIIRF